MTRMKLAVSIVKRAVAAVAFSATGLASAAVPGFYLAGTVGQSSTDFEVPESIDLDKTGIGYELAVGYQFDSHLAVEAAYVVKWTSGAFRLA